jgi:hypothetical protein
LENTLKNTKLSIIIGYEKTYISYSENAGLEKDKERMMDTLMVKTGI